MKSAMPTVKGLKRKRIIIEGFKLHIILTDYFT